MNGNESIPAHLARAHSSCSQKSRHDPAPHSTKLKWLKRNAYACDGTLKHSFKLFSSISSNIYWPLVAGKHLSIYLLIGSDLRNSKKKTEKNVKINKRVSAREIRAEMSNRTTNATKNKHNKNKPVTDYRVRSGSHAQYTVHTRNKKPVIGVCRASHIDIKSVNNNVSQFPVCFCFFYWN